MQDRVKPSVALGGILSGLLVLALYWPARENGFIWDDLSYVLHAPAARDPSLWREAIFHAPTGESVFRPLALLSLALQSWTGETSPGPYHLVNLVIHATNVTLVTLLAWLVIGRITPSGTPGAVPASICGFFYGAHPALSESVIWIAGRFDLLMVFLLLLALLIDAAGRITGWKRAIAVGALFLGAMLCKETAVGFLAALPFVHLATSPPAEFRGRAMARALVPHYKVYLGLGFALAIYMLFRLVVLGPALGMSKVMARYDDIGSAGQHVFATAASLGQYLYDAIWPFADAAPNRTLALPVDRFQGLISLGAVLGLIGVVFYAARSAAAGWFTGMMIFSFLASLLPVSNIIPAPAYVDELQTARRYLTFPLVFLCLAGYVLAASAPARLAAWRAGAPRSLWILIGAWLAGSVVVVRETIPLWKDEGVFYRWAISRSGPSSWPYLYLNLGGYYVGTGALKEARETFMRLIELQPRSRGIATLVWYNLGNVEDKLGNVEPAGAAFRTSLMMDSGNPYSRIGLGRLERIEGRPKLAAQILEEGLRAELLPSHESALRYQLGLAYRDLGRIKEAEAQLMMAREKALAPEARAEAEQALRAIRKKP